MKHSQAVAHALETLANKIRLSENPRDIAQVYEVLERVRDITNICLYNRQKQLILNAKHDYDPNESGLRQAA